MRAWIFFILFLSQLSPALAQPVEKLLLNTDKQWYYSGESIWFAVNTFSACGDSLAQLSSVVYLELIGTDAKPVVQAKLKIENAQGDGAMVIGDNIASGNYTLVAYTSWMKNFGAGIFVRKPVHIVNPLTPDKMYSSYSLQDKGIETKDAVLLQTSKKLFGKREAVKVNIAAGKPARVSVSAYRVDELEKGSHGIFMSHVPDPCHSVQYQAIPFPYERRGHVIVGKVIDLRTQQPVKGIHGYLSSVDYPDQLFMATSDSFGIIRFDVGELAGKTELVLQTNGTGQQNYMIELINPFADSTDAFLGKGNSDVFETSARSIDEALVSAQVQKIFAGRNSAEPLRDPVKMNPFYGKADGFYLMSDYERFTTVEEISREYVLNVGVQRRGGKSYPIVYDLKTQKPFREAPLILVNGIPLFDADRFMNLNTDELYSIAVVAVKLIIGSYTFHGVIDVRLNTAFKEFGPNARVVDYDGIALQTDFVSPDYSTSVNRNNRKPDFRNVLYWNPLVKTDGQGNAAVEFYTSDLEGNYVVVVQSVSGGGEVNTGKLLIEVK